LSGRLIRAVPTIAAASPVSAGIAELPEEPDVAVFCLGSARVLGAFVAAAERGIKGAVIYDGGFAEQGEDGGVNDGPLAVLRARAAPGGGGTGRVEEQPRALRNYLTTRHPDGALMLLNCYLSFPSSAKVARDCLINSANSRL